MWNPNRNQLRADCDSRPKRGPGPCDSSARGERKAHRPAKLPDGFTLVELLVTITIIGILAGMMLGAVQLTRSSAKVTKTKATVTKLHELLMPMYESYRTRRVPLATPNIERWQISERRLNQLRDLMRMEMPQRWTDVIEGPIFPTPPLDRRPALSRAYLRRFQLASQAVQAKYGPGTDLNEGMERLYRHDSAECLYMIVTMSSPEASDRFSDNEVADTDDDGLPEFVDGWGNPIYFLRWAPGVNDSDLQPVVTVVAGSSAAFNPALAVGAVQSDYDPFDTRRSDYSTNTDPSDFGPPPADDRGFPPRSWRLVPLIYSAGPDGIYDILDDMLDGAGTPRGNDGNPFYFIENNNRVVNMMGAPNTSMTNMSVTAFNETNNSLDHYDNIHNHRIEAGL